MPSADDLYVKVRLLAEPSLWCWEILARGSGRVVFSSWEGTWTAYPSQAEASEAGIAQLRRLQRSVAGEPRLHRPDKEVA